ncbi:MAG: pilus assembly PilX family protein, partial [Arenimonas sp.]
LCPTPTGSATDRWRDSSTTWRNATVSLGQLNVSAPQYIIEPLGSAPNWPGCDREVPAQPNCFSPRYRITARSSSTDRALVILQVNYAVP